MAQVNSTSHPIKTAFIALGLSCGSIAATLAYIDTPQHARQVVLMEEAKHRNFQIQMAEFAPKEEQLSMNDVLIRASHGGK